MGGNTVTMCSSRQDQKVMPIRQCRKWGRWNHIEPCWRDGALWSVFWPAANEGSSSSRGWLQSTEKRLLGRKPRWGRPQADFRANAASLLPQKVAAILKVSRVKPARCGTVRVDIWRAFSSCRENGHGKKKWSVWRRWNLLGQLSKPIWRRSAGWKCREPEISTAESHRSASSQFSLVRSDMTRLLYYRFILSGFTPVKVLLKDRFSSTPEKYTLLYLRECKTCQQINTKELKHFGIAYSRLLQDTKAVWLEFQKISVSEFNSFTWCFLSPL